MLKCFGVISSGCTHEIKYFFVVVLLSLFVLVKPQLKAFEIEKEKEKDTTLKLQSYDDVSDSDEEASPSMFNYTDYKHY